MLYLDLADERAFLRILGPSPIKCARDTVTLHARRGFWIAAARNEPASLLPPLVPAMRRSLRRIVRLRAGRRCEYCRLHESDQPLLSFHIEHIVARKHHGPDYPDNLAWACLECNLGKSSNLSGRDLL